MELLKIGENDFTTVLRGSRLRLPAQELVQQKYMPDQRGAIFLEFATLLGYGYRASRRLAEHAGTYHPHCKRPD